jgi:hypothetical protein
VVASYWPKMVHADHTYRPLDLNRSCGPERSWELTKKTKGGGGSPATGRRRPSAAGNGGRWAACDGEHGGGLRRLSGEKSGDFPVIFF